MRIIDEEQLDFDDVLIMPRRSSLNSRSEVDVFREFKHDGKAVKGIPIMCSPMGTIGTPKMAEAAARLGCFCALEKHVPTAEIAGLYGKLNDAELTQRVFPTIGVKEDLSSMAELKDACGQSVSGIVIDVPNGYCPALLRRVSAVRNLFPDAFVVAGNVVTPDMCQDIVNAGASAVKVGIGSGSACLTRRKTGVGRPQFSTVVECADACHQMNAFCVSDGGCVCPGDVCKALCAGADMVMCGSMFAGADEADSESRTIDGKRYRLFYGMSSALAQNRHFGGMASYRASEGREVWIESAGPLKDIVDDICGGLRSCGTYIGAKKIKSFSRQAAFYRVRRQLNTVFERNPTA